MADSQRDSNNHSTTKNASKQTLWNWLFAAVLLLGSTSLISACSSEVENASPKPQELSFASEPVTSTILAPAIIAKEIASLNQGTVESPTITIPATAIPSITPIPTASATDKPTEIPASPRPLDTQAPIPPTATATATKSPPLPTPVDVYSWTLKVPILMYHYISTPPDDADKYRTDLSVTPQDFSEQMAYLADNGFQTIDLYDLSLAITNKRELPSKPVVITMDDGYQDNYENAFPILQEYGMNATFFVVTEFIDNHAEDYMTWEMIGEMSEAGMRIEPHSKTHADLSAREREFVVYEILGSMETIAAHTGERPRFFCYPGGRYNETTLEVVEELDFWGAVTTASGKWHNYDKRYEWSRLRMRNTTALPEFVDLVNPGEAISGKNVNS